MPYMKLSTPDVTPQDRERIARELTEAMVHVMTRRYGRGFTPGELRERCTVHFTPYEPATMAVGGRLMQNRDEQNVTMEFSDCGMTTRLQARLARELTPLLGQLFCMDAHLERVRIRFHPYPPTDFAVGGRLLSAVAPRLGQLMQHLAVRLKAP